LREKFALTALLHITLAPRSPVDKLDICISGDAYCARWKIGARLLAATEPRFDWHDRL